MRKASHRPTVSTVPYPIVDPFEKHYTPKELAGLWGWGADYIRSVFAREPGVLKVEGPEEMHKRRYRTIKIPESVARRVHARLTTR